MKFLLDQSDTPPPSHRGMCLHHPADSKRGRARHSPQHQFCLSPPGRRNCGAGFQPAIISARKRKKNSGLEARATPSFRRHRQTRLNALLQPRPALLETSAADFFLFLVCPNPWEFIPGVSDSLGSSLSPNTLPPSLLPPIPPHPPCRPDWTARSWRCRRCLPFFRRNRCSEER